MRSLAHMPAYDSWHGACDSLFIHTPAQSFLVFCFFYQGDSLPNVHLKKNPQLACEKKILDCLFLCNCACVFFFFFFFSINAVCGSVIESVCVCLFLFFSYRATV